MTHTYYDKIYTVLGIRARHTGRHARSTSLGPYVMYAQAVQSVRLVESTAWLPPAFRLERPPSSLLTSPRSMQRSDCNTTCEDQLEMKIDTNSSLWIVGTSQKWEKGNISHESSSKDINNLVLTICNLPTMFEGIGCSTRTARF